MFVNSVIESCGPYTIFCHFWLLLCRDQPSMPSDFRAEKVSDISSIKYIFLELCCYFTTNAAYSVEDDVCIIVRCTATLENLCAQLVVLVLRITQSALESTGWAAWLSLTITITSTWLCSVPTAHCCVPLKVVSSMLTAMTWLLLVMVISLCPVRIFVSTYIVTTSRQTPELQSALSTSFYSWVWPFLQFFSTYFSVICCRHFYHIFTSLFQIPRHFVTQNPLAFIELETFSCPLLQIYWLHLCAVFELLYFNVSALIRHVFTVTFYLLTMFSLFDNFAVGHCCCFYVVYLFIIGLA